MVSRWFRFTVVTGLCGVVAVLAGATSASAKLAHVYTTSFTGSGASALSEPAGIAVNNQTGNVYAVDKGHDRVEEFDPSGTVIGQFNGESSPTGAFSAPEAIAVDNSTSPLDPSAGDIYVTDTGHKVIDKFSASGTYLGQIAAGAGSEPFGTLFGVAVDTEGKLWVYQGSGEIDDYSDALENTFIATREDPRGTNPAFAVDSEDNLYVKTGGGNLAKLSSGGSELEEEVEAPRIASQGVTVNPADGYVYFDTSSEVSVLDDASHTVLESFGSGHLTAGEGVAVNPTSGTVYVADSAGNDVAVFAIGTLADAAVEPVSSFPSTSSAVLSGTVNPDGTTVTGCEFEYGTEAGVFTGKAACSPAPPLGGEQSVAVSVTATGLTQGLTYYYRLAVANENGPADSSELKFFMPATVVVEGERVSFVETNAALLEATVNPGGAQAAYHFEYGRSAGSYEASVPIPDRDVAAGLAGVRVSAGAAHLTPGTTYHYRVVASNGLPGAIAGPDQTFTTTVAEGASPVACGNEKIRGEQTGGAELPDCRAYEKVSPLDKNGNNVSVGLTRSSASGDAVTYDSYGSFGQPQGAELSSRYVSRRGSSGWTTENISPPYAAQRTDLFTPFQSLLFTPELSKGVLTSFFTQLPSGAPDPFVDLYLADLGTGVYEKINYVEPPQAFPYGEYGESPVVLGGSSDLSRIAFEQKGKLTPEAAYAGEEQQPTQAYVWFENGLHLLSISPAGTPFKGESFIGGGEGEVENPGKVWHAVSGDGLRVFFGGAEEEHGTPQLYLRENPERPQSPVVAGKCTVAADACTVEVSASQREPQDPHVVQRALFAGASADGSRVFFTSRGELTADAFTGGADNASNLYEYDVETGGLRDLTVDTEDSAGAAVLDLVSAAEDGSYVYFVAEGGKLASNENARSERAVTGKPNLFVYHAGQVRFIATLAGGGAEGSDAQDWNGKAGPLDNTARASADGTHLAFESVRSLTGYDNQPAKPGGCEREHCREVYLYDAGSERLVCASCDPSGARPVGPAELGGLGNGASVGSQVVTSGPTLYVNDNLSEDGSRLFFESPDPLVRSDSNGRRDVYEYENGLVRPVSDVSGGSDSLFMDASPSGDDVFIATADRLVGADGDGLIDVYDARVGGGFAEQAPPPECDNGDSCRAPVSPQPGVYGAPASATLAGRGNVTAVTQKAKARSKPKSCKPGRKRKRGKCVKAKGKRSSKANDSGKRFSGRGK